MSFYGVQRDADGSGYMTIFETPDDAMLRIKRYNGLYHPGPGWTGSLEKFAYDRKLKLVFFANGGYVKMAKRYRQEVKKFGQILSLMIRARISFSVISGRSKVSSRRSSLP